MDRYHGVVQNVVLVGEGQYRVTFRAYREEEEIEARMLEMSGADARLYSMIARLGEQDYSFTGEGELSDCVTLFTDNKSVETVDEDDRDKWELGVLANEIASSLAEREMLVPVSVDEE